MAGRAKPILLIVHNDQQQIRQITKMTSELADVITARDSVRAIAMIDSAATIGIVLVGKSEDGIGAITILKHLRARRPQARGIMLADPGDLSSSIEALHSGVVDHVLNLPFRERELTAIIALPAPRPPSSSPQVVVKPGSLRAV